MKFCVLFHKNTKIKIANIMLGAMCNVGYMY